MLRNYLKIAWRSLVKSRLFTLLNLLGLALGLTVSLLLILYVKDELSFDKYHTNAANIYRIGVTATFDGKSAKWANAPNAVGPSLKNEVPEVVQQARILLNDYGETAFVNLGDKKFTEKKLYWVDGTIFEIFDIKLLQGNPKTALQEPNKIVLSQATAKKYFGDANPMGKIVKIGAKYTMEVTGVYEDLPHNFTLDAELMGSFNSVEWASKNLVWSNSSFETYVLLKPGASQQKVEAQMTALLEKNIPDKSDRWFSLWLQPLTDIHLNSADITNSNTKRAGDAAQVKILSILALVVLVIACINYMNLSTARSQKRFKEVGINKTIGATNAQLIGRFYTETLLTVLLALILGLVILVLMMPFFNDIAGKELSVRDVFTPEVGLGLLAIFTFVTFVSGSYPAFYLSSFAPKSLLQAPVSRKTGAGLFRQSLVVIQFSASIILIICTFIFFQQLRFIQNKKLGYNPEQVVAVMTSAAENKEQIDALINNYKDLSNVLEIARAQAYPGTGGSGRSMSKVNNPNESFAVRTNRVNGDFAKVLNLKFVAGKTLPLTKAEKDTTVQIVVNETTVKLLGYKTPQDAIGKFSEDLFWNRKAEIVGVVRDFHYDSFHQPIGSYVFHNNDTESRPYVLVKINTGNVEQTMKQLEATFRKSIPNSAFEYLFLDQYLNTLYATETQTARVVFVFSGLAILIACLGLFGLAAFTAEQRTKEIGIRKVLGASVAGLTTLISKDFMKLIVVAVVIASPIAWYFMNSWLKNFAYQVTIQWWVFVVTGLLATLIALLTVSYQAIKAALVDPVKSLKTE
ncbi:ABC transporter permease [Emticicia sp. 21SJ11W-3]|uniref:ABC transporter permease n=1 Tax=Emticicia sp. 21SJ11W-3 TaxID=2916755 RepID=UPI0020A04AFA|nr:ABC transporter permease [Emticicia sp. 21SJ11W-3]UTA67413.1 ABC transporter permease [Emticicia sp. 21SJ11W-3]